MTLILFLLELTTLLCLGKNILHLDRTQTFWRLLCISLITLCWSCYVYFSNITIPNTFAVLAIILLLYTEPWYFKSCLVLVYSLLVNITSNINIYLYCMLFQTRSIDNMHYYIYSDVVVLLGSSVLSFILRRHIPSDTKAFQNINVKGYLLIIAVALIDFFLSGVSSLLFYDSLNLTGKYLLVIAIIITIFISILLLILYFYLQHYHVILKERNSINQKMLALEERHYNDFRKKNEDLRAFRHDYNFHIMVMQELAKHPNPDKLKNYVNDLSNIKEQVYYLSTNHAVSDAIVNYFYENSPQNVLFELEGKFPENIFVNDSDLCVILSNLLKNASEAVEKETSSRSPKIYMSLYADTEYLSILIENTSTHLDSQIQNLTTTKADSLNHGFGLRNVKNIVNKYHGYLDLQHENNIFRAICYLRNIK